MYSLAEEMKSNIHMMAAIAIDGILTHKNTCSIGAGKGMPWLSHGQGKACQGKACLSGKTRVTADRDKIEFRLFNSSSIFNITLREELFSSPKQNQPCCLVLVSWR